MDFLPDELMLQIFGFLTEKDLIRISKVNKRFRTLALSPCLWKQDFKVLVVPNCEIITLKRRRVSSGFKVSIAKFNSLTLFLNQITCLKVVKLNFYNIDAKNTALGNFDIKALTQLQCLTLTLTGTSVIPVKITLPSSLKHFSLAEDISSSSSQAVNYFLSVVHQCCPELEHFSVDLTKSGFVSLRKNFPGLDFIFCKVKKSIRTAIVRDSLFSKPSLSTKFMHECERLEALCVHVNGDVKARRRNASKESDRIVVSNLLSETKHKNLQMLGLYGINELSDCSEIFYKHTHVYSNIRMLCIYNLNANFKTFSEYFPNLLVFFMGAAEDLSDFDDLAYFVRRCVSLRQIGIRAIPLTKKRIKKLVELKRERPSLEIFTDGFFDFLDENCTFEEVLKAPLFGVQDEAMGKIINDNLKDINIFKFDNFFQNLNSSFSGCFSEVCDELKGLLDQLQKINNSEK